MKQVIQEVTVFMLPGEVVKLENRIRSKSLGEMAKFTKNYNDSDNLPEKFAVTIQDGSKSIGIDAF